MARPGAWALPDHASEGQGRWDEFSAPISPERTREAMQESLDWADRQPPDDEFARLQAARARHYLVRGEWIGKRDAGRS